MILGLNWTWNTLEKCCTKCSNSNTVPYHNFALILISPNNFVYVYRLIVQRILCKTRRCVVIFNEFWTKPTSDICIVCGCFISLSEDSFRGNHSAISITSCIRINTSYRWTILRRTARHASTTGRKKGHGDSRRCLTSRNKSARQSGKQDFVAFRTDSIIRRENNGRTGGQTLDEANINDNCGRIFRRIGYRIVRRDNRTVSGLRNMELGGNVAELNGPPDIRLKNTIFLRQQNGRQSIYVPGRPTSVFVFGGTRARRDERVRIRRLTTKLKKKNNAPRVCHDNGMNVIYRLRLTPTAFSIYRFWQLD